MSEQENSHQNFKWKNVGHQYFATIAANLIMIGHGTILGWVSPVTPILLSENTPLESGPLTSEQLSWIGSINSASAAIGPFFYAYLTSIIGCKRAMLHLTLPSAFNWVLVYFGTSYYHLIISRFVAGFSGGGIIRGRLGSFLYLSRNVGILIAYVAGAFIKYEHLPCILISFQVAFAAIFICLPNTPQFYVQRQEFEKAEKSIKYYKGIQGKTVEESIAIKNELERLKAIAKQNKTSENWNWRHLCCDREAIFGIQIGVGLAFISQLSGSFTFISYSTIIFEKTGSDIDPFLSSIVIGVLLLLGAICTAQFVEILGRKLLSIISLVGSAIGLSTLSLYLILKQNGFELSAFSWLPLTCFSFVIFITSAGIILLASVCTVEHLPSKIRTFGMMVTTVVTCIFGFVATKFFPILIETIDLHGCLLVFAALNVLGSLFMIFFVSETKGQSLDTLK